MKVVRFSFIKFSYQPFQLNRKRMIHVKNNKKYPFSSNQQQYFCHGVSKIFLKKEILSVKKIDLKKGRDAKKIRGWKRKKNSDSVPHISFFAFYSDWPDQLKREHRKSTAWVLGLEFNYLRKRYLKVIILVFLCYKEILKDFINVILIVYCNGIKDTVKSSHLINFI